MSQMQRLAVYDMDKTLTHDPTWVGFLRHAQRRLAPWRRLALPLVLLASVGYFGKLISRARLKELSHWLLLGREIAPAKLERVAQEFADQVTENGVFTAARRRIAEDKAAGYRIVMATASHRFYAKAIGDRLGFDDVIGTQAKTARDGSIRAWLEGHNCFGPWKLTMIQAWMAEQGIAREEAHVRFYSDHVSDAPTFAWADEAFAVNAHGPLKKLAKLRGWVELDWER